MNLKPSQQPTWLNFINLTDSLLGTKILYCTDDFFASVDRMLQRSEAIFIEDKFDENGKWMDGWETRRRRSAGHDFAYVKLAKLGIIYGFNLATHHFTGNFAPKASIMGTSSQLNDTDFLEKADTLAWEELVPNSNLQGDTDNLFDCQSKNQVTHLRINLFPDGGLSRLRAYGEFVFDENILGNTTNVCSVLNGARAIYANDEHYGKLQNTLVEHSPINMADGWETRRRREPGHDWGVIALARSAIIMKSIVDTTFFKGNYPSSCSIQSANIKNMTDSKIISTSGSWEKLMDSKALSMNQKHEFTTLLHQQPVNYIRLNIFPDGGIMRLKLIGEFA